GSRRYQPLLIVALQFGFDPRWVALNCPHDFGGPISQLPSAPVAQHTAPAPVGSAKPFGRTTPGASAVHATRKKIAPACRVDARRFPTFAGRVGSGGRAGLECRCPGRPALWHSRSKRCARFRCLRREWDRATGRSSAEEG